MASNENYDLFFKFIIIGDAGTGKSAILHRFIEDRCMFSPFFFFVVISVNIITQKEALITNSDCFLLLLPLFSSFFFLFLFSYSSSSPTTVKVGEEEE